MSKTFEFVEPNSSIVVIVSGTDEQDARSEIDQYLGTGASESLRLESEEDEDDEEEDDS